MIYVVRHGQTDWNLEGRFQGRIDIPLNEKGKSQAKKTKEKLEGIKFDKVFSSPLKRALETAKIITDEPIDIDDRIIERCNGQLEGKLKTECENMVDFTDENEVKIHYEGTCDQDTIFNMTNHAYFNLAGHESGPALSQMVYIDSDAITAVDKVLIPTGEIRKVMGTPMDFSDFKPIGRDIEADYDQLKLGSGYDHNWILNHESGIFSLAAAAIDEESGRKMEVYTDLPGVQFYTGNFLDGQVPGKGGVKYARRQGYCFETQYYPNAVNMPGFASPIVKQGEKYDTTTSYKFMTV